MIYFLYDVLLMLAVLVYLPFYAIRGRVHPKILMRLGFFERAELKPPDGVETVWVHAVSVGEARAAESLVRLVRAQWPRMRVVVSTVTPTGYAILRRVLKDNELAFFAPLDISWVVRKFLKVLRPRVLVIMETELWPNLIRLTAASGAKVVVVNGRISDRSFSGYARLGRFLKPVLWRVDLFCMQSEQSAERIRELGVLDKRVRVTGNIKFDLGSDVTKPLFLDKLRGLTQGQLLLIAGSTHDNEEELILSIYKSLKKDFANLRLIIAPRHLERVDKIRQLIRVNGLEAVLLSRLGGFSAVQVALLDTMGDLTSLYELADVVFVGGSLVKKGGHNPIEPAMFGKPVLFGSHMDNFREIRDVFVKEDAAIEVEGIAALEYELRRLLASPSERRVLGDRARLLLDRHRGAAERTISEVARLISFSRGDHG